MSTESFSDSQTAILNSSELKMVSKLQRLLWLGNLLYYQIIAILTIVMLWVFFENNALSSLILWHMVLCTMAYIPLMAVAIISFSKDNLPTLYVPRQKIYLIHGVMLTISCAAATVGISVEVNNKAKNGSTHFHSTHAILGLTSWILVFCSVCFGILAANTQVFARYIKPVVAKLLHNILGIGAFVIGVACFMVMFKSHHYKSYLSSGSYYASYCAGTYIIIWSLLAAFKSLFSQFKNVVS